MSTPVLDRSASPRLSEGHRPLAAWVPWALAAVAVVVALGLRAVLGSGPVLTAVLLAVVFGVLVNLVSRRVEGRRRAADRTVTTVVSAMFLAAMVPLASLLETVVSRGIGRFDGDFFAMTMRNVIGEGGGALHAIAGTLIITALAALISVPIGMLTAIYLVEYGRGRLARSITFLVDVMTGIPSIVAGLFAYALFVLFFGPGVRFGIGGAVALSVLMVPVVVRAVEEMLKLVPAELREASYALGVPKWRTILKVVLPAAAAGIGTGITLAVARVIGETAPLAPHRRHDDEPEPQPLRGADGDAAGVRLLQLHPAGGASRPVDRPCVDGRARAHGDRPGPQPGRPRRGEALRSQGRSVGACAAGGVRAPRPSAARTGDLVCVRRPLLTTSSTRPAGRRRQPRR